MAFYAYILASQRNGTLYIGHTDSISRRIWQHQEGESQGFVHRYGVTRLVYYEVVETRSAAFQRERAMKKWRRAWKIELIERFNPSWRDISEDLPPEQQKNLGPRFRGDERGRGTRRAQATAVSDGS